MAAGGLREIKWITEMRADMVMEILEGKDEKFEIDFYGTIQYKSIILTLLGEWYLVTVESRLQRFGQA